MIEERAAGSGGSLRSLLPALCSPFPALPPVLQLTFFW
jgi:hypothetical protein